MTVRRQFLFLPLIATLASCDMRSGTAKEEMEKWEAKPTASVVLSPTPTPIDPADIVQVDTTREGDLISANGDGQNATKSCTKSNRVIINGDKSTITIKGACRQIMINGDGNKVSVDAAMEFVINGGENNITYTRFANGKAPSVVDNRDGNVVEKVSAQSTTTTKPQGKK